MRIADAGAEEEAAPERMDVSVNADTLVRNRGIAVVSELKRRNDAVGDACAEILRELQRSAEAQKRG